MTRVWNLDEDWNSYGLHLLRSLKAFSFTLIVRDWPTSFNFWQYLLASYCFPQRELLNNCQSFLFPEYFYGSWRILRDGSQYDIFLSSYCLSAFFLLLMFVIDMMIQTLKLKRQNILTILKRLSSGWVGSPSRYYSLHLAFPILAVFHSLFSLDSFFRSLIPAITFKTCMN